MYKSFLKHGRPECCCRTRAPASSAPLRTAHLVACRCCIASWLHFLCARNISVQPRSRVRRAKRRPSLPAFCGETKCLDARPPRASRPYCRLVAAPLSRLPRPPPFVENIVCRRSRSMRCQKAPSSLPPTLFFLPASSRAACSPAADLPPPPQQRGKTPRRSIYKCRLCFPP